MKFLSNSRSVITHVISFEIITPAVFKIVRGFVPSNISDALLVSVKSREDLYTRLNESYRTDVDIVSVVCEYSASSDDIQQVHTLRLENFRHKLLTQQTVFLRTITAAVVLRCNMLRHAVIDLDTDREIFSTEVDEEYRSSHLSLFCCGSPKEIG